MRRREFIKHGLMAAAALSATRAEVSAALSGQSKRRGAPKKVVVVGAGLAGLAAAYELTKAGHDVTVLEARMRPGGRVLTLREPFSDALFAEAGAARIPSDHTLTLAYAKEFGLALDPFYPTRLSGVSYFRGRRTLTKDGVPPDLPYAADSDPLYKIRGGTDLLPRAFAARLSEKIRYGTPAVAIEQDERRARVTFTHAGGRESLAAERVLLALPFPVLGRIEITPALSELKRRAVGELRYEAVTRVFLQARRRYWQDDGLNGFGTSDLPEEIWQPTYDQPGPRGIIMSYMRGERARLVMALKETERVDFMLEHMEAVFPGMRANFERGVSKSWGDDEWAGGAYALFLPDRSLAPHVARPEGRLHFAGEHASDVHGWMQGALESGRRAAREINEAE